MKTNKYIYPLIYTCIFLTLSVGCQKEFLDEKPSSAIIQPLTISDMTGLLESSNFFVNSPALPILSEYEYDYIDFATWQSTATVTERNAYIYASDLYAGEYDIKDWSAPYTAIFYANNVLSGLEKISVNAEEIEKKNFLKGWALFNRAYNFYNLATSFCKPYDNQSSTTDLGIPLRLKPDIDEILPRSTLKDTYNQILNDLNIAKELMSSQKLPTVKKNRPSLTAVYALQARIFLNMRDYDKAESAADSCLSLYSTLIDYNSITLPNTAPFSLSNVESIYSTNTIVAYPTSITGTFNTFVKIKQSLLDLYETNDLRLKVYYLQANGGFVMNKSYFGGTGVYGYTGLATDEILLIKAECAARGGRTTEALSTLNTLLVKRFPTAVFVPKSASTAQQALDLILQERQKELVWRGLRWEDIKRLNKEGANITLTRVLNGVTYTLPPNDPRYVFPIPNSEITLSGIVQNQR